MSAHRRGHANPDSVWKDGDYPFNQAVAEPSGRRVHLTGQVAWDAEGRLIGGNDASRQTEAALENIRLILDEMGGGLEDIVSLTTYFVRDEDKQAISAARAAVLQKSTGPAATGIRVAGLWAPDLLVELTAVAVIPEDRYRATTEPVA